MTINKSKGRMRRQTGFSILTLLCVASLFCIFTATATAQADLPPGAVIFDFNSSSGQPLERGQIVSEVTVDNLTMSVNVDSNGEHNVGMIFDTSNPGPDPDLGTPNEACPGGGPGVGPGGAPGTIGENCQPLGNVLIIPRDVGDGVAPNDDFAGGQISLLFDQPVRVLEIHILDIDEEDSAPSITFWDADGDQTLDAIQPQVVGDNGHEKFSDFSLDAATNVVNIQVVFPGSGALDSIIVVPANPIGGIEIVKYVNGADANDPTGADVPRFEPGATVAWSYHVTNTGQIPYERVDVDVTDSDPDVTPVFDEEISGNGDDVLDPGEVWSYVAVKEALDLQEPAGHPSILIDVCPSDDGELPMRNGYMNIGTVTVPDAGDSDPAHYCPRDPGIAIRKFVNGNDANTPTGADVPRLAPGDSVTWTYRVTNTGDISYPMEQVVVTDSDAAVSPAFNREISGDGDQILAPNEVWEYIAQSQALPLLAELDNPSVVPNLCPSSVDDAPPDRNGYRNIGTVTVPNTYATDPAHYCPKEPGLLIRKFVNRNDANDPTGSDVPRVVPGQIITWTYRLTNTGELPYAFADLNILDNDPDVNPQFDTVLIGDDDESLEPGEVWQYVAVQPALDLREADENSPLIIKNGCPGLSDDRGETNAYQNVGSVTAPGTGHQDVATYCNIFPNIDAGRNETFDLTYTVVNDGPLPVERVRVFAGPNVAVDCPADLLAAGESMTCQATAQGIGFRNSIGWVVAYPLGASATDMPIIRAVSPDSMTSLAFTVAINGLPADQPSGPTVDLDAAQGTAALVVTITNGGTEPFREVLVAVDDRNLDCEATALVPGESTDCRLTVNAVAGPQVLIGGVSVETSRGETVLREIRAYLLGINP